MGGYKHREGKIKKSLRATNTNTKQNGTNEFSEERVDKLELQICNQLGVPGIFDELTEPPMLEMQMIRVRGPETQVEERNQEQSALDKLLYEPLMGINKHAEETNKCVEESSRSAEEYINM